MSDKSPINEAYLGDGVYASFDGYAIVLDLRAQDTTTRIVLEPEAIAAFGRFTAALQAGCPQHRRRKNRDPTDWSTEGKRAGRVLFG